MRNYWCLFGILSVFNVVVSGAPTSRSRRCQSTQQNIHGCCDGYMWDTVENDCVECSPGYTGVGCNITCYYPLYGEYCQNICSCSPEEFCDFAFGCLKNQKNSTVLLVTETTIEKDTEHLNHFVHGSTSGQESLEITHGNILNRTSRNLLQRNWKLITILLLLLSCIVLSLAYCQPTFIRLQEFFKRLTSTLQP